MTETIVLRGAYAITDAQLGPRGVIPDGAVAITDGTVVESRCDAVAVGRTYP